MSQYSVCTEFAISARARPPSAQQPFARPAKSFPPIVFPQNWVKPYIYNLSKMRRAIKPDYRLTCFGSLSASLVHFFLVIERAKGRFAGRFRDDFFTRGVLANIRLHGQGQPPEKIVSVLSPLFFKSETVFLLLDFVNQG